MTSPYIHRSRLLCRMARTRHLLSIIPNFPIPRVLRYSLYDDSSSREERTRSLHADDGDLECARNTVAENSVKDTLMYIAPIQLPLSRLNPHQAGFISTGINSSTALFSFLLHLAPRNTSKHFQHSRNHSSTALLILCASPLSLLLSSLQLLLRTSSTPVRFSLQTF